MAADDHVLSLLVEMRREQREGLSAIDSKVAKVDGKVERMAEKFDEMRDEHADLRERVAKVEANDERDAEQRAVAAAGWGPNGTGRFAALPPAHPEQMVQPTPGIAFSPHINIGGNMAASAVGAVTSGGSGARGSTSKRPSVPPLQWLRKAAQSGTGKVVALAIAACGGAVLRHVASPMPETKIVTVPVEVPPAATATATAPIVYASASPWQPLDASAASVAAPPRRIAK
jgi:hypothetical protein